MENKTVWLFPHKCRVCGKKFECRNEYVYKILDGKSFAWFCSYRCMREYEKNHEKKKKPTKRQQEVLDLLEQGYTLTKVGEILGTSYHWVGHVRDKWR